MKLLQVIQKTFPKHKYAINAKLLGDSSELAWSNLGLWQGSENYIVACEQLAEHLAEQIHLTSTDHVLDLGVGYGASLLYWQKKYHIENIEGVEIQKYCVNKINQYFNDVVPIYCDSYLNLKHIPFQKKFDAIICIDSAYHSALDLFLDSISTVLNSKGRVGFHYLARSDVWTEASYIQKVKTTVLLKSADVHIGEVRSQSQIIDCLHHFKFQNVEIIDLSEPVFLGFAKYIEEYFQHHQKNLDVFKIKMTAKLCRKLFEEGLIQYVLVTAQYE